MYRWFNANQKTPLFDIANSHMQNIRYNYSLHHSLFHDKRNTITSVYVAKATQGAIDTWNEYFPNAKVHTTLLQGIPQSTYDVMISQFREYHGHASYSRIKHDAKYLKKGGYFIIENIPNDDINSYKQMIVKLEDYFNWRTMNLWLVETDPNFLVFHKTLMDIESPVDIPHTQYGKLLLENWKHVDKLNHIMNKTILKWYGCGSYMCDGTNTKYQPSYFEKQEILYEAACESQNILELGVHGGHSLLICLLANPQAHIRAVDICFWEHTDQCVQYLQNAFPLATITLHQQSSQSFVKGFNSSLFFQPDLVHMDGDHDYNVVYHDTLEILGSHPKIMVYDDYDSAGGRPVLTDLKLPVTKASNTPYRNCIVHFQGTQETLMVTAYFKLDRNFEDTEYKHYEHDSYITHARNLFRCTPLIKWAFFTNCPDAFKEFDNVIIYETELSEIAGELLTDLQLPCYRNEKKDTKQYLAVQNMKFYFVTSALEQNSDFSGAAWLDAGTMMHLPDSQKEYAQLLLRVSRIKPNQLYIPGFHRMLGPQPLHNGPIWTFAGSFFVGDRQSLHDFKNESWYRLIQCVNEGRLTWELNIWHDVYQNPKWSNIFCHATDHTLTPIKGYLNRLN